MFTDSAKCAKFAVLTSTIQGSIQVKSEHLTKSDTRFNADYYIFFCCKTMQSKQILLYHYHQNHVHKHTGDSFVYYIAST
jgi:hypothetical protein